jgi:hypothetical protein
LLAKARLAFATVRLMGRWAPVRVERCQRYGGRTVSRSFDCVARDEAASDFAQDDGKNIEQQVLRRVVRAVTFPPFAVGLRRMEHPAVLAGPTISHPAPHNGRCVEDGAPGVGGWA